MSLYRADLDLIAGPRKSGTKIEPQLIQKCPMHIANGVFNADIIELEVTLLDREGKRLTPWTRIPVSLREGAFDSESANSIARLDGPSIRQLLIACMTPTNPASSLVFAANKSSLIHVPSPPPQDRRHAKEYEGDVSGLPVDPSKQFTINDQDNL